MPSAAESPSGNYPQTPPRQRWVAVHGLLQRPQWSGSLATRVQTPPHSSVCPPHSHCPARQTCPLEQVMPQAPQLVALFDRSMHAVPHKVSPPVQLPLHDPIEQT
jgi:hypothetical protein